MGLADLLDAVPVVRNTTERNSRYPAPAPNQRVMNLETGAIERWNGAWFTDFPGNVATSLYARNTKVEGCVGDGGTDDYVKFNTLVNTTMQPAGGQVDVIGTLKIGLSMAVPANIHLNMSVGQLLPAIGVILTINGTHDAAPTQKFGGAGTVLYGVTGKMRQANARWFGAIGDGVARDTEITSINAASAAISAGGGGSVYVPSGQYKCNSNFISVIPYSNVELFGDGYASLIDTHWNALMLFTAMHIEAYPSFAWKLCSAVAAGDQTLTLSTIGNAAGFPAGTLFILRSVAEDAANFPTFVQIAKVKSVNLGTGVVTLERPIMDAIADPEIGVAPILADTVPFCENFNAHHLRFKADYTNGSTAALLYGLYNSKLHHLWLEGANGLIMNGWTACEAHDITEMLYSKTGQTAYVLECKQGTTQSHFHDFRANVINSDGGVGLSQFISLGERSSDLRIHDFDVYAPNVNCDAAIDVNDDHRHQIHDIKVQCRDTIWGLLVYNGRATRPTSYASRYHDIDIFCRFFETGINIIGTDAANADLQMSNVKIRGTNSAWNGGATLSGMAFGGLANDVHLTRCVAPGKLFTDATVANIHLHDCVTDGPFNIQSWLLGLHNHRFVGTLVMPGPANITDVITSSLVAHNTLLTFTVPANWVWKKGDKIRFRVHGDVGGVAGAKTIALSDVNGQKVTIACGAAEQGPFVIDVELAVVFQGTPNVRYGGFAIGPTFTTPQSNLSVLGAAAQAFKLEAWVANAADNVYIHFAEIEFIPVGFGQLESIGR